MFRDGAIERNKMNIAGQERVLERRRAGRPTAWHCGKGRIRELITEQGHQIQTSVDLFIRSASGSFPGSVSGQLGDRGSDQGARDSTRVGTKQTESPSQ